MDYRDRPRLEECFRWYGPGDPVPLHFVRHTGATGVFTALHEIPCGVTWPREAVRNRRELVESAGLRWVAVESVPVHEDIKTGAPGVKRLLDNYAQTLRHLAAEGIRTVVYNFMPLLDWVRTDMHHVMPDGTESLRYDPVKFCAFEIHALGRRGAEADFTPAQRAEAAAWWNSLSDAARHDFIGTIIDVFPGEKRGLTIDDIRVLLAGYEGIGRRELTANLGRFLAHVVPVAAETGVRLALHPDDPPFSLLGLPRIVSTSADVDTVFALADDAANGLCFCSGSFGVRPDNDLPAMASRFASRIHAVHLRATQREPGGAFHEADHLDGDVELPALLRILLDEQDRRRAAGEKEFSLPLRPDHGHLMMHELEQHVSLTPGYSAIGRMRGLAELRGVMHGLRAAEFRSGRASADEEMPG